MATRSTPVLEVTWNRDGPDSHHTHRRCALTPATPSIIPHITKRREKTCGEITRISNASPSRLLTIYYLHYCSEESRPHHPQCSMDYLLVNVIENCVCVCPDYLQECSCLKNLQPPSQAVIETRHGCHGPISHPRGAVVDTVQHCPHQNHSPSRIKRGS